MDILGALSGVVAGEAFGFANQQARADYLVQGATGGVARPWAAVSSGIGGTFGYAITKSPFNSGLAGMKQGVQGGVGEIPNLIVENNPISAAVGAVKSIETILLVGGVILAVLMLSKGE